MSADGKIDIELEGAIFDALKMLREDFQGIEGRIEDVEKTGKKGFDGIGKAMKMLNFNAITEGLGNLSESLSFTNEIGTLKNDISRLTDASGTELDQLTRDAYRLGEVWEQDAEQIAKAANTMTKTIGGSFGENMALIEQGFEKGANANGDMLRQLEEYSPFVKQLGLDASETLAFIASATKNGVFDDKAMDALKEANLSLREMGQGQIDALTGIGIKATDLVGKTTMESVKMISTAMKTADTQAKQLVLADIFKGAGEDAGLAFVEGLDTMDLNIENIPSVTTFGTTFTSWLSGVKMDIFEFAGDTAAYLQPITDLTRTFSTFMPVLSGVGSMVKWLGNTKLVSAGITKMVTAAQWLWNAALNANPIGAVVLAIGVLTAGVYALTVAFDSSSEAEIANQQVKDRAIEKSADERVQLELLMIQLRKTTEGSEERAQVMDKLNNQYPEILSKYDQEKMSLEDINRLNAELIANIDKRATAEASLEILKENKKKELELQMHAKDDASAWENAKFLGNDSMIKQQRALDLFQAKKASKAALDIVLANNAQPTDLNDPDLLSANPNTMPSNDPKDDSKLTGFSQSKLKNAFSSKASGDKQLKSLVVNIDNLVNTLNITQSNRAETVTTIKNMVSEALVGAVKDFEVSM